MHRRSAKTYLRSCCVRAVQCCHENLLQYVPCCGQHNMSGIPAPRDGPPPTHLRGLGKTCCATTQYRARGYRAGGGSVRAQYSQCTSEDTETACCTGAARQTLFNRANCSSSLSGPYRRPPAFTSAARSSNSTNRERPAIVYGGRTCGSEGLVGRSCGVTDAVNRSSHSCVCRTVPKLCFARSCAAQTHERRAVGGSPRRHELGCWCWQWGRCRRANTARGSKASGKRRPRGLLLCSPAVPDPRKPVCGVSAGHLGTPPCL